MLDITPRDIRRITAFFTMYREGTSCISHPHLYPGRICEGVKIFDTASDYCIYSRGGDDEDKYLILDSVFIPVPSTVPSIPIALAFALGLPWYIRQSDPMESRPVTRACPASHALWDIGALRWLRIGISGDRTSGQINFKAIDYRGGVVVFNGKGHPLFHRNLQHFMTFLDAVANRRSSAPSRKEYEAIFEPFEGFSGLADDSPYKFEELGGEDIFAGEEESGKLLKAAQEKLPLIWETALEDVFKVWRDGIPGKEFEGNSPETTEEESSSEAMVRESSSETAEGDAGSP